MSYNGLANVAGLSINTVKKIFRRHYDEDGNLIDYFPSTKTLTRIAEVFNVTYDNLIVPDIDILMQDVRIAKDSMKDEMFFVRKKKWDAQRSFHSAMIEKGFQQTVVTVDYLQFMGYEVRFIANFSKYDKRILEEQNNAEKLKKEYRKKIDKYAIKKATIEHQLLMLNEKETMFLKDEKTNQKEKRHA